MHITKMTQLVVNFHKLALIDLQNLGFVIDDRTRDAVCEWDMTIGERYRSEPHLRSQIIHGQRIRFDQAFDSYTEPMSQIFHASNGLSKYGATLPAFLAAAREDKTLGTQNIFATFGSMNSDSRNVTRKSKPALLFCLMPENSTRIFRLAPEAEVLKKETEYMVLLHQPAQTAYG